MNVGQLRDMLEDLDDDTPILVAHQPNYPLQEELGDVVLFSEVFDQDEDYEPEEGDLTAEEELAEQIRSQCGQEASELVYLVLSGHPRNGSPYGPRVVFH